MKGSPAATVSSLVGASKRSSSKPTFQIFNWVSNKDNLALLTWWASAFGGILVVGYYLILRESPVLSTGQVPLLLMQAFGVGLLVAVYLSYMLVAPSWGYNILSYKIGAVHGKNRKRMLISLAKRNFMAQLLFASGSAILVFSPYTSDTPAPLDWAIASEIFIFSAITVFFWNVPAHTACRKVNQPIGRPSLYWDFSGSLLSSYSLLFTIWFPKKSECRTYSFILPGFFS